MTGDTQPRADDDRRGWVILGNWVLVGLGVACVAAHVGTVASMFDSHTAHDWDRMLVALVAIPSALIGLTLGIAVASRKAVPRLIRRVELLILILIAAGIAIEVLSVD